ncbi:ATP-binding protein [Phocaeicola sp.]
MRNTCITLLLLIAVSLRANEGIPFFRNYTSAEYGGHNRNFDVVSGNNGMTYFANFEGVLSFDNSTWRMIYTPGYSRITRLFMDSKGTLWAGGYNIVAKIITDSNRRVILKPIVSDTEQSKIGEIQDIFEENEQIFFYTREKGQYQISSDTILKISKSYHYRNRDKPYTVIPANGLREMEINHSICLHNGWKVLATQNEGLIILDNKGKKLYAITEANGLCSNNINRIAESDNGCIWGVTDNGIFKVYVPSMFSHYTPSENLKGEVTSIQRYRNQLYIGTLRGLYVVNNGTVFRIPSITQACWQLLLTTDNKLYAATSEGLFEVEGFQTHQLTKSYALSLASEAPRQLYVGEMNGVYRLSIRQRKTEYIKVADIDKVVQLSWDNLGGLIAKNLLGNLYYKEKDNDKFIPVGNLPDGSCVSSNLGAMVWHTDSEGKNIYVFSGQVENRPQKQNECLRALKEKTVRTIYPESDSLIWIGGDFGAIRVDFSAKDAAYDYMPQVFIREVTLNADSLYFGGNYLKEDWNEEGRYLDVPSYSSNTKSVSFKFSTDAVPVHRDVEYQYCLEGYDDTWSSWTGISEKTYTNLFYGSYTFKVRMKDSFGRYSSIKKFHFKILWPFYLKWYSIFFYILLFVSLVFLCIRWRLRKLVKEKETLERIVVSRTRQIVKQKNEIEEKSENLGKALRELRQTQADLVRQEKMATVGKLTKGLIDRILNPLNYINNFSHLSSELVNDLRANFNSTENNMNKVIWEDSMDILDMMASNLKKIEEHGGNTSRILKAMEEVLKDRNRQKTKIDIVALCRHSLDMLNEYYKEEINRMKVALHADFPVETFMIQGNEEQLGKTLMSLLNNGMYALLKKYAKNAYLPEIGISMEIGNNLVTIHLKDNGIGIEESILEQIFDPFFTTKTTGEAAGVGLYLSKEIITNHNGNIQVYSCKDEYTEFIINLPIE